MEFKVTLYDVRDGVATITLNRPDRLNAWTGRLHTEYRARLAEANGDPEVGAIIVTGAGRGFCVGGDAAALDGHARRGGYDAGVKDDIARPGYGTERSFDASFAYHYGLNKPIVAAINGPAAGVGLALACFADLRFAAPGVKLTTAHGKLNLPAEYGLSWVLPRAIGLARANELLLSSRVFTTDEACEMGLINGIVADDELQAHVFGYCKRLIDTVSPNSLRQTRWQVYRDLHRSVAESVDESEALISEMMTENDYREGVAAFLAKRPPSWGRDPKA